LFDAERMIVASNVAALVGLPVAEAEGVHLEPFDAAADRQALEQLAIWCEQFGPIVGVDAGDAGGGICGDGLLLDLRGVPFDRAHVARLLAEQGAWACGFTSLARLEVRIGVGSTVGAAWALARYRQPLPVAALRLPTKTIELLYELGIRRVSELDALPRDHLATRFPEVIRRLDQFHGLEPEPIESHQQPAEIVIEHDLEHPLTRHEMIEAVLEHVVTQVAAELAQRQLGAIRLEVTLRCQPTVCPSAYAAARIVVGLFQANNSAKYLLELMLLQLGRLPGPLVAVRAAVLLSAPLEVRQRTLFDDHHDRQRQLAAFVDRISCRSPALRAVLVPDAQPEHAFRYEPLAGRKRRASKQPKLPPRPLLVEPRPLPMEAIAARGAPAQFQFRGRQYRVTRCWGPERIQTGWWRGTSHTSPGGYIRRDYYRVQTAAGSYWLFRAQGKWFLHGVFD
jgi:protein ImuB